MTENLNKKTLFICDLDNTITERQLTQAFKEEGYAVNYIRINKSKFPNGLNTAFVNFENEADAAKALENLNHLTLGRTELCIVYATNKPTGVPFSYDANKTVFVKGVPKDIETVILIKIFSSMFGEISNLRVMRNEKNESRGYGYITFKNDEDAKKAIDHNKDQEMKFEINGVKYSFKFEFNEYKPKESRQQNWTNTYVRDYPADWTKEKLTEFAEKVGPTKSVVSNYKPELELAYGFANFADHEDAKKFVDLDGTVFYEDTLEKVEEEEDVGDRKTFRLYVRQYIPKDVRVSQIQVYKQQGCGIFITSFGLEIKLNDINKEFGKFGKIYSSTIYEKAIHELLPGADPRFPRALVLYEKSESAQKATSKNGANVINGKQLQEPIFVDLYKSRGANTYKRNMIKTPAGAPNGQRQNHQQYNKTHYSNINNYNTGNFFEDQFKYNGANVPAGKPSPQLEAVIREYLQKTSPEHVDKMPKILDIFTQMFNEEEIQQCIANQSHVADYITAILSEM